MKIVERGNKVPCTPRSTSKQKHACRILPNTGFIATGARRKEAQKAQGLLDGNLGLEDLEDRTQWNAQLKVSLKEPNRPARVSLTRGSGTVPFATGD